jgi:hypothetical protein
MLGRVWLVLRQGYRSHLVLFERTGAEQMLESYPSFYFVVARFIMPARKLKTEMSDDTKMDFITSAHQGFDLFLRQKLGEILPRSTEKANAVQTIVKMWMHYYATGRQTSVGSIEALADAIDGFSVSFQDELDRIPMFTVTPKGNLDIRRLAKRIGDGFPKSTTELLNDFVMNDINHSGKCLAFDLPTSSGFHILRAVETCAKAYVHAATGKLPGIKNRNWGEYILQLEKAGAHPDVIDLLRILKAKRNPLMHPYDNLDVDEAIALLCLCQAGIDTIVADLRKKSLEVTFTDSLKALPTL